MHRYSINTDDQHKIVYIILIISTIISLLVTNMFAGKLAQLNYALNENADIQYVLDLVSLYEIYPNIFGIPLIYKGLYSIFDKYAWRWKIVRRFLNVADLNGKWEGTLSSSYNGGTLIEMKLEITQTWTHIKCTSHFDKSDSESTITAVYSDDSDNCTLYFAYINKSKDISSGMQMYGGFNELKLSENKLEGSYFNNRPNLLSNGSIGNSGTIELTRIE